MRFCIVHHVSVGHPLGENPETMWVHGYRNPQQLQDVRMGQVFPTDDLSAQPLGGGSTIVTRDVEQDTLNILSESASLIFRRLMATGDPKYSPSLTSADPPR